MQLGTPASEILVFLLAYAIGGIPFGWLLAWTTKRVDLRKVGSGGTGATNASRLWSNAESVLIFIAVFALDFGKGLLAAMLDRGLATGFTKPVGQRYALVDDIPADEDAILMHDLFGLDDPLQDMSPVHIPRGFTKAFIRGEVVDSVVWSGCEVGPAERLVRSVRARNDLTVEIPLMRE